MSPTRRDPFKRIGAAGTLASVFDLTNPTPDIMAAVNGFTLIHWAEQWSLAERGRFLDVIEREFPELAADVVDHMQRRGASQDRAEDQP